MLLYSGTAEIFIKDNIQNSIAEKLKLSFFSKFRYVPSEFEVNSWKNSLQKLSEVFQAAEFKDNGVLLEYQMPLTSKRLDCMITGKDSTGKNNAVIIELKQWSKCHNSNGENEVVTWVAGNERELLHPSVQARHYMMYLKDVHPAFSDDNSIELNACSYLHNYHISNDDVIINEKFKKAINQVPLYSADDKDNFKEYLVKKVGYGNGLDILKKIEHNEYKPSKKLMNHVANIIKGKSEYVLLDEQQIVYDKVIASANEGYKSDKKNVIIIKGGPGTGKSVIAINLMADLLEKGYKTHYATGSKAFTETLRSIIGERGSNQFSYFNSYMNCSANELDVLICDESHRIRKTSNDRFTRKELRSDISQIEELLRVAKVSVFFIDDKQLVRPNEIGSAQYIREHAEAIGCDIWEIELKAQFRCKGSDGFVNWIDNTLGIRPTANILWNNNRDNFDFKIFKSPIELENAIREKVEEGFTARVTAGFCWPWAKKPNEDGSLVNDIVIGNYVRPWNARHDATRLQKNIPKAHLWAHNPNGINQVGCIYTAQGFEFDYVGVIIGKDLIYDLDNGKWIGNKEASYDSEVKKSKDNFVELIKNTYRVLLSRGMKGCYVYFEDRETEWFFRSRME